MPLSQFTIYSASDPGAPTLVGQTGSLIALLDACLVNGYGSKLSAGWSKPLPNYVGIGPTGSIGCWKQGSGSMMTLVVNDGSPTSSAATPSNGVPNEAWFHGWESIIGLTASVAHCIGSGSGNFPSQATMVAYSTSPPSGSCYVFRKSATTDTQPRRWMMFADAHTFYLYAITGDSTGVWTMCCFGDIYSYKPTPDLYKCYICGRGTSNQSSMISQHEWGDMIQYPTLVSGLGTVSIANQSMARTVGGGGNAVNVVRIGDVGKANPNAASNPNGNSIGGMAWLYGNIPAPNPQDNTLYISPVFICETTNGGLRGRMRGFWHLCHPIANFADGQIISGANENAGKTFQILKQGGGGGMFCMEISATVDTNPPNP